MKHHTKHKGTFRLQVILPFFILLFLFSCSAENEPVNPQEDEQNVFLIMTRATASDVMNNARMYIFNTSNNFYRIANTTRQVDTLTTSLSSSIYNIVLISASGSSIANNITTPSNITSMMWRTTDNGTYLNQAPELLYAKIDDIEVQPDTTTWAKADLYRNVARIDIITQHMGFADTLLQNNPALCYVELHEVPTTLRWNGELYPDKNNPDISGYPVHQAITFNNNYVANNVSFFVPAHRGIDALNPANPVDTTTHKVKVKLCFPDPENPGNPYFATLNGNELIEIPVVPKMNRVIEILFRIYAPEVDSGSDPQEGLLDINVKVKDWENPIDQTETFD